MSPFRSALSALAVVVALSASARADTYEFIVSNFDGYGSYATFNLSSNPTNVTNDSNGIRFIEATSVFIDFAAGAPVQTSFSGQHTLYYTPTALETTMPLDIGFGGTYGLVMGTDVQWTPRNLYAPVGVLFAGDSLDTFLNPNAGTPAFELGTFSLPSYPGAVEVTIVDDTPEPSTFVLLGTGFLGLVGLTQRRPFSANL
jgi:PEP-CTERM motif